MKNNKPKMNISVSREHAGNEYLIKDIFKDFDINFSAGLMRLSSEELPMRVIIFLSGAFVGGAAWDLFKLAIKNLFKKFPQSQLTLRDSDSIIYSVKEDFKINVIVIPERIKEFEHIKTLDDLIEHVKIKNND